MLKEKQYRELDSLLVKHECVMASPGRVQGYITGVSIILKEVDSNRLIGEIISGEELLSGEKLTEMGKADGEKLVSLITKIENDVTTMLRNLEYEPLFEYDPSEDMYYPQEWLLGMLLGFGAYPEEMNSFLEKNTFSDMDEDAFQTIMLTGALLLHNIQHEENNGLEPIDLPEELLDDPEMHLETFLLMLEHNADRYVEQLFTISSNTLLRNRCVHKWEKIDSYEDMDEFPDTFDYADNFETVVREAPKIGRNDLCPCGSGKKYKKCCLKK